MKALRESKEYLDKALSELQSLSLERFGQLSYVASNVGGAATSVARARDSVRDVKSSVANQTWGSGDLKEYIGSIEDLLGTLYNEMEDFRTNTVGNTKQPEVGIRSEDDESAQQQKRKDAEAKVEEIKKAFEANITGFKTSVDTLEEKVKELVSFASVVKERMAA